MKTLVCLAVGVAAAFAATGSAHAYDAGQRCAWFSICITGRCGLTKLCWR